MIVPTQAPSRQLEYQHLSPDLYSGFPPRKNAIQLSCTAHSARSGHTPCSLMMRASSFLHLLIFIIITLRESRFIMPLKAPYGAMHRTLAMYPVIAFGSSRLSEPSRWDHLLSTLVGGMQIPYQHHWRVSRTFYYLLHQLCQSNQRQDCQHINDAPRRLYDIPHAVPLMTGRANKV